MGQSYPSLLKDYNLGESTIYVIIQSEDQPTEYALEIQHTFGTKRIKHY